MALTVTPVNNPTLTGVSSASPSGLNLQGVGTGSNVQLGKDILVPAASSGGGGGGTTSGGNGGGGGTTATVAATPAATATLSPAEIAAALAQLVAQQQTEQNQFNAATATNSASDAQQALNEQSDVQNNTGARANAIQNADQAAATGNQGLKAVLASLGALGGTGQVLAGRAVADSANSDIGNADSTYTTNAQKIAQANDNYLSAKALRDQTLQSALTADQQGTANSIYQDIVNKAQNIGDTATANEYLSKIIGTEAPVTPISAPQALYNGADTAAYAPNSTQTVTSAATAPGTAANVAAAENAVTPVNSALYTTKTNT